MMKRIQITRVIPILFLLFAAFILGFLAPNVRASNGNPHKLLAMLESLPQKIESIGSDPSQNPSSEPLPLIGTYSAVMERLKSDYYGKEIVSRDVNPSEEGKVVSERELTYDAIRGTLRALGDPFTRFMDPDSYKSMREENEGNFTGIGAQLDTNKNGQVYIKEAIDDTPAKAAGLKSNDIITAVDDKSISNMDIEDVVKLIRGPADTKVKLTLQRAGHAKPIVKVITRKVVQYKMVTSKMVDVKNKIGYIRLYQFNDKSDEQFDKAMTDLEKHHIKGLVFDLRGNPGGLLTVAVDIGSRFLERGPVVIIQERGGQQTLLKVEEDKHNHKRYPLAVLVDKSSASASEIVSGAIKDDGVGTLVGTTTFGKGRVQTILPLQDGSAVAITTAKYLTPKGTDIHKKGIAPDIRVEASDTIEPMDPVKDNQLVAAINVVKVKLGLLPKSTLDKMAQGSKTDKPVTKTTKKLDKLDH